MMPAFTFVLVFISLLLSGLLKAVLMPIAIAPNSIAADCLESPVLNGDGVPTRYLWNLPSHSHVPLATIQSDSTGEGNG